MAKHLKLTIKNTQIAKAVELDALKEKLAKKKAASEKEAKPKLAEDAGASEQPPAKKTASKRKATPPPPAIEEENALPKEEAAPRRARSKSVFAEPTAPAIKEAIEEPKPVPQQPIQEVVEEPSKSVAPIAEKQEEDLTRQKTPEELRRRLFRDEEENKAETVKATEEIEPPASKVAKEEPVIEKSQPKVAPTGIKSSPPSPPSPTVHKPRYETPPPRSSQYVPQERKAFEKLGPTGRHVKDLAPPKRPVEAKREEKRTPHRAVEPQSFKEAAPYKGEAGDEQQKKRTSGVKEYRDVKPARRPQEQKAFDSRDRQGLRDDDERWRKKRSKSSRPIAEEAVIRPTSLKVRVPISIKDLAAEMKLKSSQLIAKLFLQGIIVTLNDTLDDETTIQLLGQEFGCEIALDTTEEKRIQITDKSIDEEISQSDKDELIIRSPIVTFMGHVDHGKTSLIDAIRKSNRVSGEAGAITQHIGAFRCHTPVGDITILDTPGHEAFSAMRERGTTVTDIVVLVVAGDEGIRQQTLEAIKHALDAGVTIVVAINKADKPNFNAENIYRQLSEHNLLPEVWGGQTLTVNTSAVTGEGIPQLLENLALQAEILELKADPKVRARGTVLESELHKGLGSVATVLVQNGTLRVGDALVFETDWGRVKTMRDEFGKDLAETGPSTPASITGLSGVPDAGEEFIVVKSEREAREIAEARRVQGVKHSLSIQKRPLTAESFLQQATPSVKKTLHVVLRADVQGSLEALRTALEKIESQKADILVISSGVGEVSESDIQMANTSKAVIIGFHTKIESHAESMLKQLNVKVRLHDVIYHAIDDVKELMRGLLEKLAEEVDRGKAEVKAVFKSSQIGLIAGCMVIEGSVSRNHFVRVIRNGENIGKAQISSLKRVKEDVREVTKGFECGILLSKFSGDIQVGDVLESYEIKYIEQEL